MRKQIHSWIQKLSGTIRSRKGASTLEYVVILVAGAILASVLYTALADQEGLIKKKIEQAIRGELTLSQNHVESSPQPPQQLEKRPEKQPEQPNKADTTSTDSKGKKGIDWLDLLGEVFGIDKDATPWENAMEISYDVGPATFFFNLIDNTGTIFSKQWDKDEKAFSIFGHDITKREVADFIFDFNPLKSVKEIFTGKNRVTEEKLSWFDRGLNIFGLIPEGGNIVKGGLNIAKKPLKGLIGELGDQFTKHASKSAKKFIDPARKKAADVYCGWFGYEPISSPYATIIYLNKGSATDKCKDTVVNTLGGEVKDPPKKSGKKLSRAELQERVEKYKLDVSIEVGCKY